MKPLFFRPLIMKCGGTFFVGRDGPVREIYTGFTGRASGELDSELKAEITNSVTHLLAENTQASTQQNEQ